MRVILRSDGSRVSPTNLTVAEGLKHRARDAGIDFSQLLNTALNIELYCKDHDCSMNDLTGEIIELVDKRRKR